jgi:hypothetical protein
MKNIILPLILVSTVSFAQNHLLGQLTIPQTSSEQLHEGGYGSSSMRYLEVSSAYCEIYKQKRAEIEVHVGTSRFSTEFNKLEPLSNLCSLTVFASEKSNNLTGFTFTRKFQQGGERSMSFMFDDRAMNDIKLAITDDSQLTGSMSHDLLETTIQFIPRRVIPYIKLNQDTLETKREVVLSTGESIIVDFANNKIVGGVLESKDIDLNPSRHARKFVGLSYKGNGVMIRADRRAGTPRHIYRTSFNSNEKISKATLSYQGDTCYVDKALIWANSDNADLGAYMRYESDQELVDKVITPICGWDIDLDSI